MITGPLDHTCHLLKSAAVVTKLQKGSVFVQCKRSAKRAATTLNKLRTIQTGSEQKLIQIAPEQGVGILPFPHVNVLRKIRHQPRIRTLINV